MRKPPAMRRGDSWWRSLVPPAGDRSTGRRHSRRSPRARLGAGLEPLEDRRLLTLAVPLMPVEPTVYDQYLLELINRGRLDPAAESTRYGIDLNQGLPPGTISEQPKQPLAFAPELIAAARGHTQWMLDTNTFSHTGAGRSSPCQRMVAAGYHFVPPSDCTENLGWRGTSGALDMTDYTGAIHAGLFGSPGHRANQMDDFYREAGVGVLQGTFAPQGTPFNGVLATEKFARSGSTVFLTGVAYDDLVLADQLYTPGEGLGGVTIQATRESDGQVFSTQTWESGGYTLPLPSGTYSVVATGGPLSAPIVRPQVVVSTQNVKIDFIPTDNVAPVIASLNAAPNPVTRPHLFTVSAQGVSDPDGIVVQVEFYRGNQLLGADQDGSDGWTWTVGTAGWNLGEHALTARAQDNDGAWSELVSTTVIVWREVADMSPPQAVLNVIDIDTAGGATHQFTITFVDNLGIDASTLGDGNVRVRGPGVFQQQARLIHVDQGGNGLQRTATYEITAPDGAWDTGDSGIYEIWMLPLQVGDLDHNYVRGGRLGTFAVTMDPSQVGDVLIEPAIEVADDRFEITDGQLRLRRTQSAASAEPTVTVWITVPDTGAPDNGAPDNGNQMQIPVQFWTHAWQNPAEPLDVNRDGAVTTLDALLVINQLNAGRGGPLRLVPHHADVLHAFPDVNGDQRLTPFDVLQVINRLNRSLTLAGEGEPSGAGGTLDRQSMPLDSAAQPVLSTPYVTDPAPRVTTCSREEGVISPGLDAEPQSFTPTSGPGTSRTALRNEERRWTPAGTAPGASDLETLLSDIADEIATTWSRWE